MARKIKQSAKDKQAAEMMIQQHEATKSGQMAANAESFERIQRLLISQGGGGNRPGEDGPYRPPNPNEAPPYPPRQAGGPGMPPQGGPPQGGPGGPPNPMMIAGGALPPGRGGPVLPGQGPGSGGSGRPHLPGEKQIPPHLLKPKGNPQLPNLARRRQMMAGGRSA